MKWPFLFGLLLCFNLGFTQVLPTPVHVNKQVILQADTFVLDTLLLVKGSVKINQYKEGDDFRINYFNLVSF